MNKSLWFIATALVFLTFAKTRYFVYFAYRFIEKGLSHRYAMLDNCIVVRVLLEFCTNYINIQSSNVRIERKPFLGH